jgi:hypothetical protein
MNPHSNWLQKGVGALGVVPYVTAAAAEFGVLSKAAGVLAELSELGSLPAEAGEALPRATIQDVADLLNELKEADIEVISVKGGNEWTQTEIEATLEYLEVYQNTGEYTKAGDAFHAAVRAASEGTTGPDRIDFNFVNEIKTSAGQPDVTDFMRALDQAEGHALSGGYDGFVVTIYDVLNGVKYFVQRRGQ